MTAIKRGPEKGHPAAPGSANGASKLGVVTDYRLRAERATTLAMAIGDAHPQDAATLCAAFLDGAEIQSPWGDPFGDAEADAQLWAVSAPIHQVALIVAAGLTVLNANALPPGLAKRALVAIWGRLPQRDRRAFLGRLDAGGEFRRSAA